MQLVSSAYCITDTLLYSMAPRAEIRVAEMANVVIEQAIHRVASSRKNRPNTSRPGGGQSVAVALSSIETTQLRGIGPAARFKAVLIRIHREHLRQRDELLPIN